MESEKRIRLLVAKAAMVRNGGAARDLLRNLPEINNLFEVRFVCLNILDEQRELIESMGIEVICPDNQWEIVGGIWNEIAASQDRSSLSCWRSLPGLDEALSWADAVHLTTGAGSMDFTTIVPETMPLHLHYLESKPGIFDDVSHLNNDGTGSWRARLVHILQLFHRKRIVSIFRQFKTNEAWRINANSSFSSRMLKQIYDLEGGVLYPCVDLTEFPRAPSDNEGNMLEEFRKTRDCPYVLTVGNLSRFKGIHESLEHIVGCGLDLVVIGGGKTDENKELISKGRELGVSVQVFSNLNSEEMRSLMRNARAVIGLAHGEAFGLTPVEAMALGVPPIFVNEGGYTDTIQDEVNGRLLGRGDLAAWREALSQASEPSIRQKFASNGLKRIDELGLSPESHASRLQKEVSSLVNYSKIG